MKEQGRAWLAFGCSQYRVGLRIRQKSSLKMKLGLVTLIPALGRVKRAGSSRATWANLDDTLRPCLRILKRA